MTAAMETAKGFRCRRQMPISRRIWDRPQLLSLVARALPSRLDVVLGPFIKGLRRRLGRDQDRLHLYHNDLHREAMRRARALPAG